MPRLSQGVTVSELEDLSAPTSGLYEQLLVFRFEETLKELSASGWRPEGDTTDIQPLPHVWAQRVSRAALRALRHAPVDERVRAADRILESLRTPDGARRWAELTADEAHPPLVIPRQEEPGAFAVRPDAPPRHASSTLPTSEVARPEDTLHAYRHQHDMLERLAVERVLHDRHHNLLVAATGTGKTVMAALDYQRLCQDHGRPLSLLFVAHRREILQQSLSTYRKVLHQESFGEPLHSGEIPTRWTHVFASVQSLNARALEHLDPQHFDVIVIDEFHHGTSPTYRKIVDHFRPRELLGLTATPERMDGKNIQDEFFDGRIAAEMRLWEALESDLLCPFHYFGISDSTDLSAVAWKRGSYDLHSLSHVLTSNEKRAALVVSAVREKVADPSGMRALGFCVSVAHAHFMAHVFRTAGFSAVSVSGETPTEQREEALRDLKSGEIQVIFSVDLFNEGVDVPDVDTLLLLRPTSSATVFLQQLGRGLRHAPTKERLTVLDFIGQHRKEFRFENQFRALTNLSRKRLLDHLEHDFPHLPAGCAITLEEKAKRTIISNIREQLSINVTALAREVADYKESRLSPYLEESGRDIQELYRGSGNSWTGLLRRAGMLDQEPSEEENALLKRVPAFLHVDDPDRVAAYTRILEDGAPDYEDLDEQGQAYARMLFFQLWPLGGPTRKGFARYQEGFSALRHQEAFRSELCQVLAHNLAHTDHVPVPLPVGHGNQTIPLSVHASYSREEILPALGQSTIGGFMPGHFREGVKWCESLRTDALLITLEKDEKVFSPQTRYQDYALSETEFHWESQNQTSENSPTGQRYQQHVTEGSQVLLFVRRYKTTDIGSAQPWMLLGPAQYASHRGSKPMAITWRLEHPLPAAVLTYAKPAD